MKHIHSPQCDELLGHLSEFIDGELDDEMCAELKRHLEGCENCRVVYDTTTRTIYLYQHSARDTNLPADVRGRLFTSLNLDDLRKPAGWMQIGDNTGAASVPVRPQPDDRPHFGLMRRGEICPRCGLGILEYNGLLDLECPVCTYTEGPGGGCTW